MRVVTTPDEDRFVAQAAKDYYEAATAVDTYQQAVLRQLRQVTDEYDSKLVRLRLPFTEALERKSLAPYPSIGRKIVRQHLEAGICLDWYGEDPELGKNRLCVYWWIWLRDRAKRESLGLRMKAVSRRPFEWESIGGTSYVSLYFPLRQSASIKENARKCTAEIVRMMNDCRRLIVDSVKPKQA